MKVPKDGPQNPFSRISEIFGRSASVGGEKINGNSPINY